MDYHLHQLKNGIRVVFVPDTSSEICHLGVIINAGTRDEGPGQEGLAHFIEHVLFKGTRKRKSYHILSRLETIGGEMNAYTTKEETCIYASFLNDYLERSTEILADILFNSIFPQKELDKEREVICDEIRSYQDNPAEQIYDDFEEQIFKRHPLGKPILGTLESIKFLSKRDVMQFLKKHYVTDQIVVSVMGNYSKTKVFNTLEKHFSSVRKSSSEKSNKRLKTVRYFPSQEVQKRPTYQAHCILGNVGYNVYDERKTGLVLLNNLLGGPGLNSRLNLSVREKYGYTYNIESSYHAYRDTGIFSIYLGTDSNLLEKSLRVVHKELKKLRENQIGTLQLTQAKRQLIGQFALAQESKSNVMLAFGKHYLNHGYIETPKEIYKKIEKVSRRQLLGIANEVFDFNNMSSLIYTAAS